MIAVSLVGWATIVPTVGLGFSDSYIAPLHSSSKWFQAWIRYMDSVRRHSHGKR